MPTTELFISRSQLPHCTPLQVALTAECHALSCLASNNENVVD